MSQSDRSSTKILLHHAKIRRRVRELGAEITRDFQGKRPHLVGVLNGAFIFLADLIREIPLELSIDFIAVSSYGLTERSSGEVRLIKDLSGSIENLDVILVEDVLDTGFTVNYLKRVLLQRRPRSLRIAALLDKTGRRVQKVKAHYVGFRIPNEFVVGYGLDYAGRYRNSRDVRVLKLPENPGLK